MVDPKAHAADATVSDSSAKRVAVIEVGLKLHVTAHLHHFQTLFAGMADLERGGALLATAERDAKGEEAGYGQRSPVELILDTP